MEKYTAFDIELANNSDTSICAIGVCVVENNKVIKTYYSKIKPVPFHVDKPSYHVHGIKSYQLINAPTFDQVWHEIKQYFENTIILAHNIQQDSLYLRATLDYYDLPYPTSYMTCSFVLSRKLLPECQSYKLDGIANYFNLKFNHHHALDDAMMCFRIIKKIKTMYQLSAIQDIHRFLYLDFGKMQPNYYRNLFDSDIASDSNWTLESNIYIDSELFHQCIYLDCVHLSYIELIEQYIKDNGGFIQDKVNLNTNLIIKGSKRKTNNIIKAHALQEKGQDIEIITIAKFLKKMKNIIRGDLK